MKKILLLIILSITLCEWSVLAQTTHTFKPNAKKVTITGIDALVIEGISGTDIVIESDYEQKAKAPERASGLKLMTSTGTQDNSGLGLAIKNNKDGVLIQKIESNCGGEESYTIRIPSSYNIKFDHSSYTGEYVRISGISGELDITANYNDVFLEDVTGPMAVKTVYGSIEVILDNISQDGSLSFYSVYEYVDLKIPSNLKANVSLKATYGQIYSNCDIAIAKDEDGWKQITTSKVKGVLNGGGVDLIAKSAYENVYLRSY